MSDNYEARSKRIVSTVLAAWVGDLDETIGLGDAELDSGAGAAATWSATIA